MSHSENHPWANKQPIKLDFLAAGVSRDAFMEQRQETLEDRRGWSPPRKRPRRVHRKLEARGFAAHYGGPRHPAAQRWQVQWRAPVLERLLHQRGDDLVVVAPDYRLEERMLALGTATMRGCRLVVATPEQVELGSRGEYEETVEGAPCLQLDESPRPPERVKWQVQRMAGTLQFGQPAGRAFGASPPAGWPFARAARGSHRPAGARGPGGARVGVSTSDGDRRNGSAADELPPPKKERVAGDRSGPARD